MPRSRAGEPTIVFHADEQARRLGAGLVGETHDRLDQVAIVQRAALFALELDRQRLASADQDTKCIGCHREPSPKPRLSRLAAIAASSFAASACCSRSVAVSRRIFSSNGSPSSSCASAPT